MRINTADVFLMLLLAAAFPAFVPAQAPAAGALAATSERPAQKSADKAADAQASARPVENADVIALIQEMGDDAVLKVIQEHDTRFDLSTDALIALKKAGVSDRVILGMLDASRRPRSAAAARSGTTPGGASGSVPPAQSSSGSDVPVGAAVPAGSAPAPPPLPANVASNPGGPATPAAGAVSLPGMPAMDAQSAAALQTAFSRLQAMGYGGTGPPPMGGSVPSTAMPRVLLLVDATKLELTPSTAQRAVSKFNGGGPSAGAAALNSLASEALSFASAGAGPTGMAAMSGFSMMSGAFFGMRPRTPSITYAWGLSGAHSARSLPQPVPSFELLYKDLPGIDPDAFEPALVRLAQTRDNYRLVGATRQKLGEEAMMRGGGTGEWVVEERVPVRIVKRGSGDCALQATKPLQPGEYALVFRPTRHYKADRSAFGSGDQLSAAVWDFSLPVAAVQAGGGAVR